MTVVAIVALVMCGSMIQLVGLYLRDQVSTRTGTRIWLVGVIMWTVAAVVLIWPSPSPARDLGQWEKSDPAVVEWYQKLMQPDVPTTPCCGEADAYWADELHVRDGKTYATITDDRPDEPRGRPHIPSGTEIEVPPNKLKWDRGNPTGHGIIFLTRNLYVLCYVQSGGF